MPKKKVFLMPQTEKILSQMGEQIRLARLRRNIPISVIAERARVSPGTVAAAAHPSPWAPMPPSCMPSAAWNRISCSSAATTSWDGPFKT